MVMAMFGCDDFLDEKPKGIKIPDTVQDLYQLMNRKMVLTNDGLAEYSPDFKFHSDSRLQGYYRYKLEAYNWDSELRAPDESVDVYNSAYKIINNANYVLDNISGAPLGDGSEKKRTNATAMAHAHRASAYFHLIKYFAPAYENDAQAKASNVLAMPLTDDITAQLEKVDLKTMLDQVELDFKTAIKLLDFQNQVTYQPSLEGINALYAKFLVYMRKYDQAKEILDDLLVSNLELHQYADLEWVDPERQTNGNNQEEAFHNNKEYLWTRTEGRSSFSAFHDWFINAQDTVNDYRYQKFRTYQVQAYPKPDILSEPYMTLKQYTPDANNAEVYLLRAEARIFGTTPNIAGAMEDISYLRSFRLAEGFQTVTATTTSEAFEILRKERMMEFAFTGELLFDNKRWHAAGKTIPTYTRTIDGKDYKLKPGSPEYIINIPNDVKGINPNL